MCLPIAANERTFLAWLSMAVTIGSVSAALVGFTASENDGKGALLLLLAFLLHAPRLTTSIQMSDGRVCWSGCRERAHHTGHDQPHYGDVAAGGHPHDCLRAYHVLCAQCLPAAQAGAGCYSKPPLVCMPCLVTVLYRRSLEDLCLVRMRLQCTTSPTSMQV